MNSVHQDADTDTHARALNLVRELALRDEPYDWEADDAVTGALCERLHALGVDFFVLAYANERGDERHAMFLLEQRQEVAAAGAVRVQLRRVLHARCEGRMLQRQASVTPGGGGTQELLRQRGKHDDKVPLRLEHAGMVWVADSHAPDSVLYLWPEALSSAV